MRRPPAGTIPDAPGSYQFKDAQGRVIYIGKAKNLRARAGSYFQKTAQDDVYGRTSAHFAAQSLCLIERASSSTVDRHQPDIVAPREREPRTHGLEVELCDHRSHNLGTA